MTVRTLKRGEALAPGPSTEFTYPRGMALGVAGKALYVTDSGQLLKGVDLSSSPHPVDTLLGQEGCGWADGSAATARLWLAKGCPWTPPVGGSGGGDGESAGCSPQEGCPDGRGSPRLFVVHAESRSGSSWLTSMITLSPQVYVHDECERSEAPGGVWKVSGSHIVMAYIVMAFIVMARGRLEGQRQPPARQERRLFLRAAQVCGGLAGH